jgi:hypothetical protein
MHTRQLSPHPRLSVERPLSPAETLPGYKFTVSGKKILPHSQYPVSQKSAQTGFHNPLKSPKNPFLLLNLASGFSSLSPQNAVS